VPSKRKDSNVERRVNDPWRDETTRWMKSTEEWMGRTDLRHNEFKEQLATNTALTVGVKEKTDEMYDILETFKGGMKVLAGLGTVAKWVAGIAAAISAVIAAVVAADELPKHFPTVFKWWHKS
jgi:hypothetical protein